MGIEAWLRAAIADAERRGLPELAPFLTALARATETLRGADFNDPRPIRDILKVESIHVWGLTP